MPDDVVVACSGSFATLTDCCPMVELLAPINIGRTTFRGRYHVENFLDGFQTKFAAKSSMPTTKSGGVD
jgi:hypothetical protein